MKGKINHIGIILDGNRRWAKERNKPAIHGHIEGVKNLRTIINYSNEIGIKYITVYAFSTENWNRSKKEVSDLMELTSRYTSKIIKGGVKENVKIKIYGDKERFEDSIKKNLEELEEITKNNTGITVGLCLNYGGRNDIVNAIKKIAFDVKNNIISINDINEQIVNNKLYTVGIPDPDLIIRPGGELRLSNFLTWQAAYSELYFDNVYWPDFNKERLDIAIEEYERRERRFGGNSK